MGLLGIRSQQVGQLGRLGMGWMAAIVNPRVGYEFDIKSGFDFYSRHENGRPFNMSAGLQATVHLFFVS
jgi:hypothetical protein